MSINWVVAESTTRTNNSRCLKVSPPTRRDGTQISCLYVCPAHARKPKKAHERISVLTQQNIRSLTMMMMRRIRSISVSLLIYLSSWPHATGQRVNRCFTGPPSCERHLEGLELGLFFLSEYDAILNTCFTLQFQFFDIPFDDEYYYDDEYYNDDDSSSSNSTGMNDVLADDDIQDNKNNTLNRRRMKYNGRLKEKIRKLGDFSLGMDWQVLDDIPADSPLCHNFRKYIPYCQFCGLEWFTDCEYREEDAPTCNSDIEPFGDVVSRELMCGYMESELISKSRYPDEFDILNSSHRQESLASSVCLPGLREPLRDMYHQCYWCDSSIQVSSFCSFDNICDEDTTVSSAVKDIDVNADETCSDIEKIVHGDLALWALLSMENEYKFYTKDLCQRARQVAPQSCPGVCQSCFNEAHPPTCRANPDDLPVETIGIISDASMLWSVLTNNVYDAVPLDTVEQMVRLNLIRSTHPRCPDFREAFAYGYWCDSTENINQEDGLFCTTYCTPPSATLEIGQNETTDGLLEYCGLVQGLYEAEIPVAATISLCRDSHFFWIDCPCFSNESREITSDYLGADTDAKKNALVWISRSAAVLSLFGACFILYDVWTIVKWPVSVYHQLVVGMVIADIVTALSWSFATLPIDDSAGYSIYGARGSDATCKAQGYFIQLGFTSVFYNTSLALYYYLAIARGWRESALRRIVPVLHAPPIILGIGLAFAGLPFYEGFDYACHLRPYSNELTESSGDLWTLLVFVVGPVGFSILFISFSMVVMYFVVRAQSRVAKKWSFGFGKGAKMERLVFWQALFYTVSFYITWPVVLLVYVTGWDFEREVYGFAILVSFVSPLQGFNNFLVYTRPRITKKLVKLSMPFLCSRWFSGVSGDPGETPAHRNTTNTQQTSASASMRKVDPSVAIADDSRNVEGATNFESALPKTSKKGHIAAVPTNLRPVGNEEDFATVRKQLRQYLNKDDGNGSHKKFSNT